MSSLHQTPIPSASCAASVQSACSASERRNIMRHSIGCSISEVEAFGVANMDFSSSRQWIEALWLLFGAYWLASALKRKKTKQRETLPQRFGYVLPLALG